MEERNGRYLHQHENVTHCTTLVARRGVTVTRIYKQVCGANGFCCGHSLFLLAALDGTRLSYVSVVCITIGAKGVGKPRRYAFLNIHAYLAVIRVTWATDWRWLGQISSSLRRK